MSVENTTEKISYLDTSLPFEERVKDLIGRMTLEEKMGLMNHPAHGIPRLNIPAYNYWSEALHGVARNGRATVFPQAIGLAASQSVAKPPMSTTSERLSPTLAC